MSSSGHFLHNSLSRFVFPPRHRDSSVNHFCCAFLSDVGMPHHCTETDDENVRLEADQRCPGALVFAPTKIAVTQLWKIRKQIHTILVVCGGFKFNAEMNRSNSIISNDHKFDPQPENHENAVAASKVTANGCTSSYGLVQHGSHEMAATECRRGLVVEGDRDDVENSRNSLSCGDLKSNPTGENFGEGKQTIRLVTEGTRAKSATPSPDNATLKHRGLRTLGGSDSIGSTLRVVSQRRDYQRRWFPELKHHCSGVPCILVATPIDLRADEKAVEEMTRHGPLPVTTAQGERMARKLRATKYFECSAKRCQGVKTAFHEAVLAAVAYKALPEPKKPRKCIVL
ncbi:hypothetical protein K438DRAFT_1935739 [Mycena galopus ATCC 62051]|nr:hypothetical protein K438DRAFT_1935739 [Mycena galopus ATCC 62051]